MIRQSVGGRTNKRIFNIFDQYSNFNGLINPENNIIAVNENTRIFTSSDCEQRTTYLKAIFVWKQLNVVMKIYFDSKTRMFWISIIFDFHRNLIFFISSFHFFIQKRIIKTHLAIITPNNVNHNSSKERIH